MFLVLEKFKVVSSWSPLAGACLPWWLRWQSVCLQCGRPGLNPWVRKIHWRRQWQPTPVFSPGKSHGWNLVGYSPWGRKELDMTERLHFTYRYTNLTYFQPTYDFFCVCFGMLTASHLQCPLWNWRFVDNCLSFPVLDGRFLRCVNTVPQRVLY